MASDSLVFLADSVGDIAVEVLAVAAATSTVEVAVVNHATAIVLRDGIVNTDRALVALKGTPVPVSTAVCVVSSLVDATNRGQSLSETRVAEATEDIAHVMRAETIFAFTTVASGKNGKGDEALGGINKFRAVDKDAVRVAGSEVATGAESIVVLAAVAGVLIAVSPPTDADDVAGTSSRESAVSDASARTATIARVGIDVVLLSPSLATVVAAASIRLRISDP